jgi:hypothetical protein
MSLADAFSADERRESFRRQFRPGVVVKLFCKFTDPQKEKRLLIVSVEPYPLFFVINSNTNEYKQKRPHLLRQQLLLQQSHYPFLEHDSYVDCSKVRGDFSKAEIEGIISRESKRLLGMINEDAVADVLTTVNDSVTLEPRHKTKIINDLH